MIDGYLWIVPKLHNYAILHFYFIQIRIMLDMYLQDMKPFIQGSRYA